jgi:predicted double-glycine peptidase
MTIRAPRKLSVPYYKQKNAYYCGPAALEMVFDYFDGWRPQEKLAKDAKTNEEEGTHNSEMIRVATENNFYCYVNDNSTLFEIRHFIELGLPVIVNYIEPAQEEGHFAVVSGITRRNIILNDPWNGHNFKMMWPEFLKRWHNKKNTHKKWVMVISKKDMHFGKQYSPTGKGK